MKKSLYFLMALAAFAMSCNQVEEPVTPGEDEPLAGIPFSITTNISTKTVIDGLSTNWVAGDQITVFNAETGSAFVSNGAFTVDETDLTAGIFNGQLASGLTAATYDWAAVYPYKEANTSLSALALTIGNAAVTAAPESKALLAGENLPCFGEVAAIAKVEAITLTLSHLAAAAGLTVKNTNAEAYTLTKLAVTFPEAVVGDFTVDVTGENPAYTAGTDAGATVTVTLDEPATIAAGGSINLFIPVKPFTAAAGSKLSVKFNDDATAVEFNASSCTLGKIKMVNLTVPAPAVPLPTTSIVENIAVKGAGEEVTLAAGYTVTSAVASADWISISNGKATFEANTTDKARLAVINVTATGTEDNLSAKYYVGQAAAGCNMVFDSFRETTLSDKWVGNMDLVSLDGTCLKLQCANLEGDDAHGQPLYNTQFIALGTSTQDVFNKVCVTYDFETNAAQCAITVYNDHGYDGGTYLYASDHQWYNSWPNDFSEGENGGNFWCIGTDGWASMQDAANLNSDKPYTKWLRFKVFSGYDFEGDGVGGNWGGYAIYNLEEDENGILIEKECKFHTAKWWWNDTHKIWEHNTGKGGYMGLWTRNHPYFPEGHFRNFTISYETK